MQKHYVPRLKAKKLSFTYPSYPGLPGTRLFEGLDLELSPGEIRVLLGTPESGKTTLSRILTGLIPRYTGGELQGEVFLDEANIPSTPPSHLIDTIGTIFQDPDEQILTTSCEAEIAFPLESMGTAPQEIRTRVNRALELTGLVRYKKSPPSSLSGGEKKKLLFAALFALEPDLWILDEPLDEVDSASRRSLLSAMVEGGYGVLIFASKKLDIFDDFDIRYSLISDKRLLREEEAGREELMEMARAQGLAHSEHPNHAQISPDSGVTGKHTETPGASTPPPLLTAHGISFSYRNPGGSSAGGTASTENSSESEDSIKEEFSLYVDELNLYPGERAALVGPNGCGKSSLAKILCGLYRPQAGSVTSADGGVLETRVAYMFQNPDYQIFLPTVEEELAYGLRQRGLSQGEIAERVEEAAEKFHLPALNVPPTVMSYGARKRLQAAVYYLLERMVYIIDEADSGLSLRDFAELIEALDKRDRALLIITHNERIGKEYCHRSIAMSEGRLV